jgi:hypothetical protein
MKHHRTHRLGVSAALAVAVLLPAAPPPVPPPALPTGSEPTVAEAAATALVRAAGPHAAVDDSSGGTPCMGGPAPVPVAYRTDRIVVRADVTEVEAAAAVTTALMAEGSGVPVVDTEVIELPPAADGKEIMSVTVVHLEPAAEEPPPIVAVARRLWERGIPAAPDYLLSPTSGPTAMWPGGEPEPTKDRPVARAAGIGAGIEIMLYDAGLTEPAQSEHPPNVTRLAPADVERPDEEAPIGVVDRYFVGHTVSIADTINTLAPGATVTVARITGADGVPTDVTAARRMARTLRDAHAAGDLPPLIVSPFGSDVCDVDSVDPAADMVPLGLEAVAEAVDRSGEAMLVVSAGNRGVSRPFYPAAFEFPAVIAVGALDTTGEDGDAWTAPSRTGLVADFSNHGDWVDGWTSGVGLATRHVRGLSFQPGGPVLDGWAEVRGTSYSAPALAALLAEEMAANRVSARRAWDNVAASGTACSDAVGGGVAVALVSLDSQATTPADKAVPPEC